MEKILKTHKLSNNDDFRKKKLPLIISIIVLRTT